MKRKNMFSRKVWPKSVVGLGQSLSADDISDLVPPLGEQLTGAGAHHHPATLDEVHANEEEPGVTVDEPQQQVDASAAKRSMPLKHLDLSRPKKPKTRLPTRAAAAVRLGNSQTASQESLDADADLSQGLDLFFHSTTTASTTGNNFVNYFLKFVSIT
jgi:hypothetical protein